MTAVATRKGRGKSKASMDITKKMNPAHIGPVAKDSMFTKDLQLGSNSELSTFVLANWPRPRNGRARSNTAQRNSSRRIARPAGRQTRMTQDQLLKNSPRIDLRRRGMVG